jgi:hypothetical protein
MKTIELSDEDYDALMELSEELQRQENDSQAFPYFWGPRSTKSGIGTEDDTPLVYDGSACETSTLSGYAENNDELFSEFLLSEGVSPNTEYEEIEEYEWRSYIMRDRDLSIVYEREEEVSEHNFSLFKSDVKGFIDNNAHHLGDNPHTYARTFFRMQKMERLIKIIYGLASVPEDDVNDEAKRYI